MIEFISTVSGDPSGYVMAIVHQPGFESPTASPAGGIWMALPMAVPGVPPGLEYLTTINRIVVHQLANMIEIAVSYEMANRYVLKNIFGQQIYYALEESDCYQRQCCGTQRSFKMHIVDNLMREVMTITRPYVCCGAERCLVQSSTMVMGMVRQQLKCYTTDFLLIDAAGNVIFTVAGPCCCMMAGCQDKEFTVRTLDGRVVGAITKRWGGLARETFTDADTFTVNFPMDLDVKMKSLVIAATFLIDFIAFEDNK